MSFNSEMFFQLQMKKLRQGKITNFLMNKNGKTETDTYKGAFWFFGVFF